MGRKYNVSGQAAITTVIDIVEITAGASHIGVIHSFEFGQTSDAGESELEQLEITVARVTTAGSGGAAITASSPLRSGDSAYVSTINEFNGGRAVTANIMDISAFNVMAGMVHKPTPEERIVVAPGTGLVFGLTVAPGDSISSTYRLVWEEVGG